MNKYEWAEINGLTKNEVDKVDILCKMFYGKITLVYELVGDEWAKSYD